MADALTLELSGGRLTLARDAVAEIVTGPTVDSVEVVVQQVRQS